MHRARAVTWTAGYRLHVTFEDGMAGEIDLADRLFGPMFAPLKDEAYFALAGVDAFGAVTWPNGADLDPDALYARLADARAPSAAQG